MNIILLGAPGSGKGTQADHIANVYNLHKLSTGDLLRAEIARKTEFGNEIKEIVESGKLVSDNIITKLIADKLESGSYDTGIVFDGFPRTVAQAESLDGILQIDAVIEIVVREDSLISRLSNRYSCKGCNVGYNKLFKNPKHEGICDVCNGVEFIVREDDRPEVIKKRFQEYTSQTGLLLPYYEMKSLIHKVDGEDDIRVVSKNIDLIVKQVDCLLT